MNASIVLLLATPVLCRVPLAARRDDITEWQQPEEPQPRQPSSGTPSTRVAVTQYARGESGGGWAFPDDKRLQEGKADGQRKPSPMPKPKPNAESEPKSESETTAAAGPKPAQEEGWTFPDNSPPYGGKPNGQGGPDSYPQSNSDPKPNSDSRPRPELESSPESNPEAGRKPQPPSSENKVPAVAPEKKLLPWIRYTGWNPFCGRQSIKDEARCGSRAYCGNFKSPFREKLHAPAYANASECLAAREKSSDIKIDAPRRKPWVAGVPTPQIRPECETLPVNEKSCGTEEFCNAHRKKEGAVERDYASAQECFNDRQLPKWAQEKEDSGR